MLKIPPLPLVLLPLLAFPGISAADDAAEDADAYADYFMDGTHILGAGLVYQKAETELRASVPNLPEVTIDLDDLGVDNSEIGGAVEYRWRFAPRWSLVAMAYPFDESGGKTLKRDFNFDGKEFTAGLTVDTEIEIDTYIVSVDYSVYRTRNLDVMLGAGVHAFDLSASIKSRAFLNEGGVETSAATSDLLAPLPNLRAQINYNLPGDWGLSLGAGWLSAKYEDYDGSFTYIHPRVAYSFGEHWAVTAGYQYVNIDLTQDRSRGREIGFDSVFQGPTLLLHYRF